MYRSLFLALGLFAISGCGNDTQLSEVVPEIEVSPRLVDFQTIEVGGTGEIAVQIDHLEGGDVDITNIVITNIDGTFFTFDGPKSHLLEQGGTFLVPITYAPLAEGWHRATLEIVSNAEVSHFFTDLRGHAVAPAATVTPLSLDFGTVEVGETAQQSVLVSNDGAVDLALTDARFSNPAFSVGLSFPLDVASGDDASIPVIFTPTNKLAAVGTLTLKVGQLALPNVALRGNDCENGLPSAYDTDGDGFTDCAGDCDDDDSGINPGAVETQDGIDQDCDGKIDDGTPGADDDGDGYCDDSVCTDGSLPNDCADGAAAVSPAASEDFTNGIDDDCDGVVDFGTSDLDGDGYAPDGGDCDDSDPARSPGLTETPDGVDNDCDVTVDEGTTAYDDDNDGYCELGCTDGSLAGDCDDTAADTNPAGIEAQAGDFRDNDCDSVVDEGTDRYDDDGDGFTEIGGDCDDGDNSVSPALGGC